MDKMNERTADRLQQLLGREHSLTIHYHTFAHNMGRGSEGLLQSKEPLRHAVAARGLQVEFNDDLRSIRVTRQPKTE